MIAERAARGDKVDVQHEEREEEPRAEIVHRRYERQAPDSSGDLGPLAHRPEQGAGDDLNGEQHVQQGEVGELLKGVEDLASLVTRGAAP